MHPRKRMLAHRDKAERLKQLAAEYIRRGSPLVAEARIKQAEKYLIKAKFWELKARFLWR
jgi:hypothetical protein